MLGNATPPENNRSDLEAKKTISKVYSDSIKRETYLFTGILLSIY